MEKQLLAQTYGQRLRYERKQRGWTRDQLAEMIDIFKTYIGRWEREEAIPFIIEQQKLCKLFGKTAEELGFVFDVPSTVLPATANAGDNYLSNRNATELFRRQLKHEREVRGWSQVDLARALDVPYPNISRWESGRTLPSQDYWEKLSKLLGKGVQELGLVPNTPEQEEVENSPPNLRTKA